MMIFDLFVLIWAIPMLFCWRALTGYYAWRIHTTAATRSGIKPEPEDWLLAGVFGAFLAPFWPLAIMILKAPKTLKTESEQEAERMSAQIKYDKIMLENERRYKELN